MKKIQKNSTDQTYNPSEPLTNEEVQTILKTDKFRLEKIVSRGHTTPPGEWYDQEENEWVMVVKGAAQLRFADSENLFDMKPGSYITIPAHCRHRVEWTDPNQETIWLAVFY